MKIQSKDKFFIYGFILGAVVFILIYGTVVLNVCQDAWIFKSDVDLRQHYLGWVAYRGSGWGFPLGMTDALSYPHQMSIVYTDSIPLIALICKIASPILPGTFQYFGWYALLCFSLTGALGARLLSRLCKNPAVAIFLTPCFVISYPLLQRTFYHTSLSSQWIILLCFELWLGGVAKKSITEQLPIWALMGVLCAGVHTYFLPMALCILCGALFDEVLRGKKNPGGCIMPPAIMPASAALTLYAFGAFTISSSGDYSIGDFTMNLNSFINPLGKSLFLPSLPLHGEMQFEGAAYLGFGVLALCLATALPVMLCLLSKKTKPSDLLSPQKHPTRLSMLTVTLILTLAAVLPTITLGSRLILQLPYPRALGGMLGIFRSNGRFIWGVMYILILAMARAADYLQDKLCGIKPAWRAMQPVNPAVVITSTLALICLILQIADLSPWMAEKRKKYSDPVREYITVWEEVSLPDRYSGFVMFEDDNTFRMGTAYYALKRGMHLNSFYFARDIDDEINRTLSQYKREILEGHPRSDLVYVLDRATCEELKDSPLHFYKTRKCAFGVRDAIDGMDELTTADLEQIKWRDHS